MNCKCITEINEKIREQTGDKDASIYTTFGLDTKENKMTICVPIGLNYRKKKANGEFMKNKTHSTIIASYCPFCGKSVKPLKK